MAGIDLPRTDEASASEDEFVVNRAGSEVVTEFESGQLGSGSEETWLSANLGRRRCPGTERDAQQAATSGDGSTGPTRQVETRILIMGRVPRPPYSGTVVLLDDGDADCDEAEDADFVVGAELDDSDEEEGGNDDESEEDNDGSEGDVDDADGISIHYEDAEEENEWETDDENASEGACTSKGDAEGQPPLLWSHSLMQATQLRTGASVASRRLAGIKGSASKRVNACTMLRGREQNVSGRGCFSRAELCHVASRYIPNEGPQVVDSMNSRAYIGQFSRDGSLFVGGYQERRILLYNVDRGWSLRKDVVARNLRWTITDTAVSPDQRFLIYASITPVVHLLSVGAHGSSVQSVANVTDIHEGLNFAMRGEYGGASSSFGLWSIQFSADGREIVGGSNDAALYIYDLEAQKPVLKMRAHADDVNAVAFADETSHLIFSGSDDNLCKVWDRRDLQRKSKPSGVLAGHVEGITHIDSKGDGKHFISNSKDQSIKLWDIRRMTDSKTFERQPAFRRNSSWDYRWMEYPSRKKQERHPYDASLMTYRGHQVLQTLIRCYFSPSYSTGQRYIYTGSHCGAVYIYDLLTGQVVSKLKFHRATVRDCSWHPTQPMLASVSWDGQLVKWEHMRGEKPYPLKNRVPSAYSPPGHGLFDSE
eukprot:jgi/Mesen1/4914/ME000246S04139